jgi:hypothetical protein
MQVGNRIIYDQDGEMLMQLGEMQGDVLPRKDITKLNFVDLEYGQVDLSKYRIIKIDVNTKKPVLEEIPQVLTEEQIRIQELENQLLLSQEGLLA